MRCTSSFFLIAPPRAFAASISSSASLSTMVLPARSREYCSSQRIASDCLRNRFHVFHGLLENFQRVVVGLLGHLVHRAVKHALRRGLLAFPHHRADKL